MNTPAYLSRFAPILTGAALLSSIPVAFAADATWNNAAGTDWVTDANWTPTSAPGATTGNTNQDTATFLASTLSGSSAAILTDDNRNVKNLTFDFSDYTGSLAYSQIGKNSSNTLLLTAGGTIELKGALNKSSGFSNNGFSAVAINPTTISLQGDYTFSANATNTGSTGIAQLFIATASTVSGAASLGNVNLTLTGQTVFNATVATGVNIAGNAGGFVNGKIIDGTGNVLSITKTGVGAWQLANNNNSFSGGVAIKQGTIVTGASNALGTGGVTLGESASANNATLLMSSNNIIANSVTVAAGSGLRIVGTNATTGTATLNGAITLGSGSSLRLQKANSQNLLIGGGITGTGDVEVYNNASSGVGTATGVVFGTAAINNVGKVTNASPGVGTLTQTTGGVIGSNVTEFIQNSTTSQTTLSLVNSYNKTTVLAGTLVVAGGGTLGTGDVTVSGSGALTLNSNISLSDTAILNFANSSAITLGMGDGVTDTVYGILDTTTGASIAAGVWTANELNLHFNTSAFTGTGTLTTLAAVPEPSIMSMALFGFGIVVVTQFRRRSRAAR